MTTDLITNDNIGARREYNGECDIHHAQISKERMTTAQYMPW